MVGFPFVDGQRIHAGHVVSYSFLMVGIVGFLYFYIYYVTITIFTNQQRGCGCLSLHF